MTTPTQTVQSQPWFKWLRKNLSLVGLLIALALFPFIVGMLVDGESITGVLANQAGNSKFYQGLLIEIFILSMYALSYELLLGTTGLLSFGHAMFFASGAYMAGFLFKSAHWGLFPTLLAVIGVGVLQALLVAVVLPRVKGITFALVTLGIASVFHIIIQSHEMSELTGGDVGLQGIPKPDFLNPAAERLRFYFIVLIIVLLVYLFYKRFVSSPTGRVCVAIRENEGRARMLGYNTVWFKIVALTISGITAALAGMLNTLYQPIVTPDLAGMGFTVSALLMVLIGGVGTLSGALVGATVFKLLDFTLTRFFGDAAGTVNGLIYVAIVMFLPYGIVGTWLMRKNSLRLGLQSWKERLKIK